MWSNEYQSTQQSVNARSLFTYNYNTIPVNNWRLSTDWIAKIYRANDKGQDVLMSFMSLLNRYLVVSVYTPTTLQTLASACAFIAANGSLEANQPEITLDRFMHYSDGIFTRNTLTNTIRTVIATLDGRLRQPTALDILNEFESELKFDVKIATSMCVLVCQLDPKFLGLDPYVLAKAVIDFKVLDDLQSLIYYEIAQAFLSTDVSTVSIVKPYQDLRPKFTQDIQPSFSILPIEEGKASTSTNPKIRPPTEKKERLCSGVDSVVMLARRDGRDVAIKRQTMFEGEQPVVELSILSTYKHENVIRMYDFYFHKSMLEIDLELGCCLITALNLRFDTVSWEKVYLHHNLGTKRVPRKVRRGYMKDICSGLTYLHANGIIHRDLKSGNIIVVNGRAKIADFGLSYLNCLSHHDVVYKNPLVITVNYRPPELLLNGNDYMRYAFEVDVWSLGCVMLEIETGAIPFLVDQRNYKTPLSQILNMVARIVGQPPSLPIYDGWKPKVVSDVNLQPIVEEKLLSVILRMLDYNPKTRTRMNAVNLDDLL